MSGSPTPLPAKNRVLPLAIFALIGVIVLLGIAVDQNAGGLRDSLVKAGVWGPRKRVAPDVVFYDRAGKRVALEDFRGKVVLLNFWATWCGPCIDEAPSLDWLAGELKRDLPDVVVLAPALDDQGFTAIDPFVEKLKLDQMVIVHDKDRGAWEFGTRKLPETWLIGRDGEIVERFVGALDWSRPEVRKLLEQVATRGPESLREKTAGGARPGAGT